jgi:hypothetical protein
MRGGNRRKDRQCYQESKKGVANCSPPRAWFLKKCFLEQGVHRLRQYQSPKLNGADVMSRGDFMA